MCSPGMETVTKGEGGMGRVCWQAYVGGLKQPGGIVTEMLRMYNVK